RLVFVGRERRDVDESRHTIIRPRSRDHTPAVGVTNENRGAAHSAECPDNSGDVGLEAIDTVLRGDRLVPLGLQGGVDLVETPPVRPDAVAEHDTRPASSGHVSSFASRWTTSPTNARHGTNGEARSHTSRDAYRRVAVGSGDGGRCQGTAQLVARRDAEL